MDDTPVKVEVWRGLYQAAADFRKAGCWDRMSDADLFGVKDPASGEIGYSCVMGNAGEHFGLGVYNGTDGLERIMRMQSGDIPSNPIDRLLLQNCIMASFEDRSFLHKEDMRVVTELGLKFRGPNAWPLFRSYRPGFCPWYLTGEEAAFLTLALRQTVDISRRFGKDPAMLEPKDPASNLFLVRVAERDGDGLKWRDEWLEPAEPRITKNAPEHVDPGRLDMIARRNLRLDGTWEIGSFHAPTPVKEGKDRPFFPLMTLFLIRDSGFIVKFQMEKAPGLRPRYSEQFMELSKTLDSLPRKIVVGNESTLESLEPVASKLGIRLEVGELVALEEARTSMAGHLRRR